jgi:hypothetical protein
MDGVLTVGAYIRGIFCVYVIDRVYLTMCVCYAGIQTTGSGQEMGQDSAVGIVICYGLDGPGTEFRFGGGGVCVQTFCTCLGLPWGPPSCL